MKHKNITGALICGGRSQRFGSDKRLYRMGDRTLFELAYQKLSAVCDSVVCVFRDEVPPELKFYPVIFDELEFKGPMAGILAALSNAKTPDIFCMPCDMPHVTEDLLNKICSYAGHDEVVLPFYDERLHPIFGIYPRNIDTKLRHFGRTHGYGLQDFFRSLSMAQKRVIYPSHFSYLGMNGREFENLNFLC